ncbi:F-box only protein 50 [Microtus ochrogaster]|uniref:F-box only protein 50 n=1 Tax=Microtus ochrogaster TaxID=79684 RepID=A0A8J6GL65_MICOH|nr:F-box only protein 50 [Microtus ochrogaster]
MEAEGSQNSEELPPPAQSPPPPPSPRSPLSPETPELPEPKAPTEVEARQLLLEEWGPLSGKLELPPSLSWRLLFLERPLYRNLLSSPNPEGINIYQPAPPTGPTRKPLTDLGNFRGWYITTENLQGPLSWTVKEQCVNLLAKKLWEELLDDEQPDITIMDWGSFTGLHLDTYPSYTKGPSTFAPEPCIPHPIPNLRYTLILLFPLPHHVAPRTNGRGPPGRWVQVSHVFRQYGPGVRYVHFQHKAKNRMEAGGLRRTRVTDSSVSVQLRE